jgi:hypothetical protein
VNQLSLRGCPTLVPAPFAGTRVEKLVLGSECPPSRKEREKGGATLLLKMAAKEIIWDAFAENAVTSGGSLGIR